MQDPSRYDDIPEDLVHRTDVLDAVATELEQLARMLMPVSIEVLGLTAARETASSSARALEAEARDALRALLLEDPDALQRGAADVESGAEAAQEDAAWRSILEQALSHDIHQSLSNEAPPWLVMRANDLARTMAVVCIGLGHSGAARAAALKRVLYGEDDVAQAPIDDLVRRFELSRRDTAAYLVRVSELLDNAEFSQAPTSAYAQRFSDSNS